MAYPNRGEGGSGGGGGGGGPASQLAQSVTQNYIGNLDITGGLGPQDNYATTYGLYQNISPLLSSGFSFDLSVQTPNGQSQYSVNAASDDDSDLTVSGAYTTVQKTATTNGEAVESLSLQTYEYDNQGPAHEIVTSINKELIAKASGSRIATLGSVLSAVLGGETYIELTATADEVKLNLGESFLVGGGQAAPDYTTANAPVAGMEVVAWIKLTIGGVEGYIPFISTPV